MYRIYFAKSIKNEKVYVGSTSKDPGKRVNEHNHGSNSWSKQNAPFKLIYYESFLCKNDALQRERFYKSGIGKRIKQAIIKEMDS